MRKRKAVAGTKETSKERKEYLEEKKKADSHDLSADETCSRSIWNVTIRYKPTVQWQRAYSPFDHSPVSMETHWGLNRYQVFERWVSNPAHRPWIKAEVSFHPSSPGLSLLFNEVWVVRFQWPPSTFYPDRRLFFPLERPPCLPLTKMRRKQNKIDTRCHNLHAVLHTKQYSTGLSKFMGTTEWLHYLSFTIDTAMRVFSLAASEIPAEPSRRVTLQQ